MKPCSRDPACGRLALADLVPVDHEHIGAGARQLAGHSEASEARSTHENVAIAVQSGPRRAALCSS
jgi:hypothetical protein